jgi:uncharacterized membrane protein YuzA (DUF378 family)
MLGLVEVFELLRLITQWFVLVGALNWGTYGLLGIDVVAVIFGKSAYATFFYSAIAFSGLFIIILRLLLLT